MEATWRASQYWNHATYSSGGEGDRRSFPFNESGDSIASVVLPRSLRVRRNGRPPRVLEGESIRNVTAYTFFLCLCSVILLTCGLALIGTSLWAIMGRVPYLYLSDHASYLGITSFTLSAGMLCFPSGWLAWAAHTKRTSGSFIPLLCLFLCVSVIMLGTGTCLGINYRTRVSFDWIENNDTTEFNVTFAESFMLRRNYNYLRLHSHNFVPKLQPGPFRSQLNFSMVAAQHFYDEKTTYRFAWDTTQNRLQCCGVNTPSDWLKVRSRIPLSCCRNLNNDMYCENNVWFQEGCLDAVAFDLSWQSSILTGIGFIVIFMELSTLVIASYFYLRTRIPLPESSVVFHRRPTPVDSQQFYSNGSFTENPQNGAASAPISSYHPIYPKIPSAEPISVKGPPIMT